MVGDGVVGTGVGPGVGVDVGRGLGTDVGGRVYDCSVDFRVSPNLESNSWVLSISIVTSDMSRS